MKKTPSLDFILLLVYGAILMALELVPGLRYWQQIQMSAGILFILCGVSVYHRESGEWHWPRARPLGLLVALMAIAGFGFLLNTVLHNVKPGGDRPSLPLMSVIATALFTISWALRLTSPNYEDFWQVAPEPAEEERGTRDWRAFVARLYTVVFLCTWLAGAGAAYADKSNAPDKTDDPPAGQTVSAEDAARRPRVTPEYQKQIRLLLTVLGISVPTVLIGGALLEKLSGNRFVETYPDAIE